MRTRVTQLGSRPTDVRFCLVFPRETLSVPVMRRVLGDILSRLGVDEECIADLLLAVTEACTNVLRHSGPGRRYEVVAQVGRNRCLLEVVDSGRGFDPAALPGAPRGRPFGPALPAPSRCAAATVAIPAPPAPSAMLQPPVPGPGAGPRPSGPWPSCPSPAAAWRSCGPASTT